MENNRKIIYDIKFPLYYNNKERTYIINIEAQKSTRASKLGYELKNRLIEMLELLASQIVKKIKNNKTFPVIAMELEQEESDIMPVYEAVLKAAPDYDMDYILSLLEER